MDVHPNVGRIRPIEAQCECLCVKFVNLKKSIAGGYMNGTVVLYEGKTHKKELILADNDTTNINNAVTCITNNIRNPSLLTTTYSGGLIKIWNFLNGNCLHTIKEQRQTYGAVYHAKRSKFFTFGDDGKVNLYDVETNTKEFVYQKSERMTLDGHVSKIFSLKFNPVYTNEFLTAGWDRTLYFWDVRSQNAIRYISNVFMGGDGISISKNGNELITCEWVRDDPLKHWDYKTGNLIKCLPQDIDHSKLYCGKYMTDKIIGIGGSDANLFRIINLKTQITLSFVKGLNSGVTSMDVGVVQPRKSTVARYDECSELPVTCFTSGKTIYEVRFKS